MYLVTSSERVLDECWKLNNVKGEYLAKRFNSFHRVLNLLHTGMRKNAKGPHSQNGMIPRYKTRLRTSGLRRIICPKRRLVK